jgi:hypothetical protein
MTIFLKENKFKKWDIINMNLREVQIIKTMN